METTFESPLDVGKSERSLVQRLEDETRAWRAARSQRHGITETEVSVIRRGRPTRRAEYRAMS